MALALACGANPPSASVPAARSVPAVQRRQLEPAPAPPADPVADAHHVLSRFAFGPRPHEARRVSRLGVGAWFEQQLAGPEESPLLGVLLEPQREALLAPEALIEDWLGEDRLDTERSEAELRAELRPHLREHEARLALVELTRHIVSERQVEEVMVDFWANHFNVYSKKGMVRLFAGDYVEHVLRPHALGRFSELLLATARHPAMLIYLDNAASVAERGRRAGRGKRVRGLNENYARELLELHTLGVDGGYTQADVVAAARALTGWGTTRLTAGKLGFLFRPRQHDTAPKVFLGEALPAGGGEAEGVALLELLARHPSTARHVARKLCGRFVADAPPPSCVAAASRAFRESGGEIESVLRAIFADASFWSAEARGNKLKSPLEFVVSAARASGALPDGTLAFPRELEKLGEPVLGERSPTGYPEAADEWSSSGGLLLRMNFAAALATSRVPGVRTDWQRLLPDAEPDALLSLANELVFSGRASASTLAMVRSEIEQVTDGEARRALCAALLLGSPEFQRQ